MSWIRFEEIRPELNARIFALNAEQLWWGDYNPEKPEGTVPFVPIFWIDRPPFTEEEVAFSAINLVKSEEKKDDMDKKIREIEKINKSEGKELKTLEKMDKKRDKFVDAGKKVMKEKGHASKKKR